MKINDDLVLEILEGLESRPLSDERNPLPQPRNYDPPDFYYHVRYLKEGGLIVANDRSTVGTGPHQYQWRAYRLTFEGHQYLRRLRETSEQA